MDLGTLSQYEALLAEWIFPLLMGGVGGILLLIGGVQWLKLLISRSWPQISGTVLVSGVEARRSTSSEGGSSTTYNVSVVYEYEVDSQRYRSNRVTVGGAVWGGYRGAQKQAARYPMGASVPVYYNPRNPTSAVLEKRAPSAVLLFVMALIFLTVAALFVAYSLGLLNSFTG
jgi:hypothetical protein